MADKQVPFRFSGQTRASLFGKTPAAGRANWLTDDDNSMIIGNGTATPFEYPTKTAVAAMISQATANLGGSAGAVVYKGDWNAETNSPAIPAASSGNKGWCYDVTVARTSTGAIPNVPGIDWQVGDQIESTGTEWRKRDMTSPAAQPITFATEAQHLEGTATALICNPSGVSAMISARLSALLSTQLSPLLAVGQIAAPSVRFLQCAYSSNLHRYFIVMTGSINSLATYVYSTSDFSAYQYHGNLGADASGGMQLVEYNGDVLCVITGQNLPDYVRIKIFKLAQTYPSQTPVFDRIISTNTINGWSYYWSFSAVRMNGNNLSITIYRYGASTGVKADYLYEASPPSGGANVIEIDLSAGYSQTAFGMPVGYLNANVKINGEYYYASTPSSSGAPDIFKYVSGSWVEWVSNYRSNGGTSNTVAESFLTDDGYLVEIGYIGSNQGLFVTKLDLVAKTATSAQVDSGAVGNSSTTYNANYLLSTRVINTASYLYIGYVVANIIYVRRVNKSNLAHSVIGVFESPIADPCVTLFDKGAKIGLFVYPRIFNASGLALNYEVAK